MNNVIFKCLLIMIDAMCNVHVGTIIADFLYCHRCSNGRTPMEELSTDGIGNKNNCQVPKAFDL